VLDGARRAEGWAFDALFNAWNRSLHSFVGARGVSEPEDVVNEIFVGVFKAVHRFEGSEADFRAWVFRIARNKIVDSHRRQGRHPNMFPLERAPDIAGGDVELEAMDQFGADRLVTLLDVLTDAQREMILLRVVGDLTIDQIAQVMGRSSGAVKLLQNRALQRLERAVLDEHVTFNGPRGDCVV
jgi:RNA polymerase sigma-70 factor (ECF subfamily)